MVPISVSITAYVPASFLQPSAAISAPVLKTIAKAAMILFRLIFVHLVVGVHIAAILTNQKLDDFPKRVQPVLITKDRKANKPGKWDSF
jgi:hypothetical protein